MTRLIIFLLTAMLVSIPANAQRRKKAPQLTPEQQEHLEKMQRMRAVTQKIMFIDSLVIDKDSFLHAYNLSPECGMLSTYNNYFKSKRQPNGYVYVPEIGKQCFFSQENNEGIINLYSSERIGNKWTRPTRLRGLNDNRQFCRSNFPYMMGDGQTLYFAAEGDEGLGGYDIYVTRYDEENNRFLTPENIGMPFNSEANDYMYVVDEYDSLGWFATDRNQAADKVCIYTFVPPTVREAYDTDKYTTEQIDSFAAISRIANTWDDPTELGKALERLRNASMRKTQKATGRELLFVVNDNVTYSKLSEFRAPGNQKRYKSLTTLQNRYHALTATLARVRNYYATASADERQELADEIISSEQKSYELHREIIALEKEIRNQEITFLNQSH